MFECRSCAEGAYMLIYMQTSSDAGMHMTLLLLLLLLQ